MSRHIAIWVFVVGAQFSAAVRFWPGMAVLLIGAGHQMFFEIMKGRTR